MKKSEANISIVLRHYLKAHPLPFSCPIEVKTSRGKDSFAFNELKEEQINNALASKSDKGNLIRIASGTVGAPDYAYYRNCSFAPIVIHYPSMLAFIDIDDFLKERGSSTSKSLSTERAKVIAYKIVNL